MGNVTFRIHHPDKGTFVLAKAILIYRGSGPQDIFASIHDIQMDGPKASILAGCPATRHAVRKLSRELSGADSQPQFIPEEALYQDEETLIWWTRPCTRHVMFDTGEARIGSRGEAVPHPGLVFKVAGGSWHVWAVADTCRPTLTTPLFQAPYFNIATDGAICAGNVDLPRQVSYSTIGAWEDAFFRSTFTHTNNRTGERLVNFPDGAYAFWRAMLDQTYASFPADVLVPTSQQLSDLLPKR